MSYHHRESSKAANMQQFQPASNAITRAHVCACCSARAVMNCAICEQQSPPDAGAQHSFCGASCYSRHWHSWHSSHSGCSGSPRYTHSSRCAYLARQQHRCTRELREKLLFCLLRNAPDSLDSASQHRRQPLRASAHAHRRARAFPDSALRTSPRAIRMRSYK